MRVSACLRTWPGVAANTDYLSNPDLCRCAGKIRSYPVAVHEDGKCTLKGLTFLSLEAAVDFFSENELDGVHLVTVSARIYHRLLHGVTIFMNCVGARMV